MDNLSSFLESISQNSDFNAELSKRGGYLTFSNSGRRGSIKSFQISLDSILQTLKDILMHLDVFGTLVKYDETSWRDNGAAYFTDPVANAISTVQTKPLFSTLSKIIIWGNQPRLNTVDPDDNINLDKDALTIAIEKLDSVANSFSQKEALREKNETFPCQQIFYGAPGTGKSHTINEVTEQQPKENVFRTTFHPDSDYSTFVGCYKPITTEVPMRDVTGKIIKENGSDVTENRIVYKFVPQSFTKAYLRAWQTTEPVFLVIEEINRGNCAQIFGDLFQLLDRKCDGFSEYPIKADNDLVTYLAENLYVSTRTDIPELVRSGEELMLPSNLYIWATMNTSDQSLFPIDSAFKRRWEWKYVPIYDCKKDWRIEGNTNEFDWWSFLEKINTEIGELTHSEDKKLGYFFCKADSNGIISADKFVSKVIFYLWNDVFKDYDFESDIFKDGEDGILSFNKFYHVDKNGNTVVRKNKVQLFLETNLELGSVDEEEDDDGNTSSSTSRNYDKFSINGTGHYAKNRLAENCVKEYIKNNSTMSADDVVKNWKELESSGSIVPHFIESEDTFNARTDKGKDRSTKISCGSTFIYVAHDGYGANGKVEKLIEAVNNKDWGLTLARVVE